MARGSRVYPAVNFARFPLSEPASTKISIAIPEDTFIGSFGWDDRSMHRFYTKFARLFEVFPYEGVAYNAYAETPKGRKPYIRFDFEVGESGALTGDWSKNLHRVLDRFGVTNVLSTLSDPGHPVIVTLHQHNPKTGKLEVYSSMLGKGGSWTPLKKVNIDKLVKSGDKAMIRLLGAEHLGLGEESLRLVVPHAFGKRVTGGDIAPMPFFGHRAMFGSFAYTFPGAADQPYELQRGTFGVGLLAPPPSGGKAMPIRGPSAMPPREREAGIENAIVFYPEERYPAAGQYRGVLQEAHVYNLGNLVRDHLQALALSHYASQIADKLGNDSLKIKAYHPSGLGMFGLGHLKHAIFNVKPFSEHKPPETEPPFEPQGFLHPGLQQYLEALPDHIDMVKQDAGLS